MRNTYFVSGTDTDAGKTLISQALLLKAQQYNLSCFGLKPVAAGANSIDGELQNDDALKLMAASSIKLSYAQVNPIVFQQAIAPHIAAQLNNRRIKISRLAGFVRGALLHSADFRLIEGAGGWLVPLNEREYLSALTEQLKLPVILVIGMKLGALNHALLTVQSILLQRITIAGWVVTQIEKDMPYFAENIQTLRDKIPAPCLGIVPYIEKITAAEAAEYLILPD